MLPVPSRTELTLRLPRLIFGLVIFGVGIAMMVIADLGLAPWDVLHQGISQRTGLPIGTVSILTGILILLLWIPLRERPGIGTVLNVFIIGIVIDLTLWIAPEMVDPAWQRWVLLLGGVLLVGVGSGFYIGVGLGPGPRDGVMTGLARHNVPISVGRLIIELSALVLGWSLGGTIGVGTVVFAFGVSPLVGILLPRLRMDPLVIDRGSPAADRTTR